MRTVDSSSPMPGYSANTRPQFPALAKGSGALVVDVEGNQYVDCCSQTLNLNLGQCHPEVVDAVIKQLKTLTYASSRFSSTSAEALVAKLIEITPEGLTAVNLKNISGSSANENAVKAARKRTGKQIIFALMHSHHGQTSEMMRISGKHFNRSYLKERHAHFLPAPTCSTCPFDKEPSTCSVECLDSLERLWDSYSGDVAAFIVEPVMVDAGVLTPPRKYFQRLRSFCSTHGIALIFDEVQTAFGWMPDIHAMGYIGVTPDIVTFGKGLGAGFPLAAAILSDEYDVLTYGEHEITYGAHPVACAASLAMIEILQRPETRQHIEALSTLIGARLAELQNQHSSVTAIRGVGLIWGIEIASTDTQSGSTKELVVKLAKEGLIVRTSKVGQNSNVIQFKPPIVITKDQIDFAVQTISKALHTEC